MKIYLSFNFHTSLWCLKKFFEDFYGLHKLYFRVWLQNKGKFLVWSEYYDHFGIYQHSRVSLLEPRQNNLSNPEAYSEPCQASKMEFFSEIVNG